MRFQNTSPMYAFTTENLSGYFHQIDLRGKNVLTVCGSGDHLFNSYLIGAQNITCFDINKNAKHITQLKKIGIQALTFEEFIKFFMRGNNKNLNPNAFDYSIYQKLRKELPEDSKFFFDSIYQKVNFNGLKARNSDIFNNNYDNDKLKIFSNPYLQSKANFNKTKSHIKPFNWLKTDIKTLEEKLTNKQFDLIMLSNISDYAKEMFPKSKNYLNKYFREVVLPLKDKHLQQDGVIVAGYIYDYKEKLNGKNPRSQIDNPNQRSTVLKNIKHRIITFSSVIENKLDSIILL